MNEMDLNNIDVLSGDEKAAERNRQILENKNVKSFNIMGSTGSGKTALIESIKDILSGNQRIGAVAGDVTGVSDYERFQKVQIPAYNLNTDSKCHLDAGLVNRALKGLNLDEIDVLFVENVGNLICPAGFELGTERDIAVISVTEGDDMVRKQPKMFLRSDILVINKIDLADAIGVDPQVPRKDYEKIHPDGKVFLTSAKTGKGIDKLIQEVGIE